MTHALEAVRELTDLILRIDARYWLAQVTAIDALACREQHAQRIGYVLREYCQHGGGDHDDDERDDDHHNHQLACRR